MKLTFGQKLRDQRLHNSLKIKDIASITNIDQALISKFENDSRLPTDKQLLTLSEALHMDYNELRANFLTEKIIYLLKDEDLAYEAFIAAEPRIEYLKSNKVLTEVVLEQKITDALAELDILRNKWLTVKNLKGIRKKKLYEYFTVNYTYESNRIEGNTLTLSDTALVINEGVTIAGKTITEHLEAINHADAIAFIYDFVNKKENFTKYNLLQLHGLVLRGIDRKNAGTYRNVAVRIGGSKHIPPQPYLVDKMMEDYFAYYNLYKDRLHPVILAAEMHERLVSIHPFIDGNGRTSRLVMNIFLLSSGFPVAILKGDDISRQKYYNALSDVQNEDKPNAFYFLIIDALKASLLEHIELAK